MYSVLSDISKIQIDKVPVREIYEEFLKHEYGSSEAPIFMQERNIKYGLVNCLRHKNSNYDEGWRIVKSNDKRNFNINYKRYKNAVHEEISKVYPFLQKECKHKQYKIQMCKKVEEKDNGENRN